MKSTKTYLLLFSILCLSGFGNRFFAQVVINEFSCSNLSQYVDNHSDYGDWFELYNTSGSAVSLAGYYLSDDSLNNLKWQIPAGITINGNGFLRFWASGRNEVIAPDYHTNFKLTQTKNNKEDLVLSSPAGVIIDQVKVSQKTQVGHSYGRTTDGALTWGIFKTPTSNASNNSATCYTAYADKPDVNVTAGFYASGQTITITTTEPNSAIYYTLDGTLPSPLSTIYTGPVSIPTTKVLKAITYSSNPQILPSFIEFDTYFINVYHSLPVVSIAGTALNTLANGNGSLRPFGSFEYFNTSQVRTAKTYGEYNKHGQDSWANSQRSLDFVSRDEAGYNADVNEKLFSMQTRDQFQRVILRAAGDDNYPADHHPNNAGSAHVRDAYIENISKDGGLRLDVREGAKAIVYLNGQYWGVYDLRDNPDDHDYTNYFYGQDKYHLQYIETWGNTWAQYGGPQALNDWTAFHNYIMANSMTIPANYQYVTDRLDVLSLTDYISVNAFVVCSDWLNYNTGWWRGMDSTGTHLKWGYILWDNDATFNFYINYTGIPNTNYNADPCDPLTLTGNSDPKGHIQMVNKLMTNPDFLQLYVSRQIDLWNTTFSCDHMLAYLDSTVAVIDPEMGQHASRWNGTYTEWQTNVQTLRNFISQRCAFMAQGFINCYNVTGPYDLIVNADPPGAGIVNLNTLTLNQLPWTGHYFSGIDTKLEAVPNGFYQFNNWSSTSQVFNPNPNSVQATINFSGADSVVAHFTGFTTVPQIAGTEPFMSAYPTLFSNHTTVNYNLSSELPVSIKVYSALGDVVGNFGSGDKTMPAGHYTVDMNFANMNVSSGMYVVELTAGQFRKSVKLMYAPE